MYTAHSCGMWALLIIWSMIWRLREPIVPTLPHRVYGSVYGSVCDCGDGKSHACTHARTHAHTQIEGIGMPGAVPCRCMIAWTCSPQCMHQSCTCTRRNPPTSVRWEDDRSTMCAVAQPSARRKTTMDYGAPVAAVAECLRVSSSTFDAFDFAMTCKKKRPAHQQPNRGIASAATLPMHVI